jgi:metal-responsive CopG/Arc/MetJ family transcriptional regulator
MAKRLAKPATERKISVRKHRQVFTLNNEENKALDRYIAKYKVQNKSKFIREAVMLFIIRKMEEDHPTLFD